MDKRPVKAQIYTWMTEDLSEYWKLIGLSLGEFSNEKVVSISHSGDVDVLEIMSQCANCSQTFTGNNFEKHICDFSDPKTMIYDDEKMDILWENSSLRKMYAENNAQIDQILKQCNDVNVRSKDGKKPTIQGNHECTVCHRIYVHASGLSRHMETQHNSNESTIKTPYQQEIKEGASAEVVKCLICGRVFSSSSSCFTHLKSAHVEYGFDETESSLQTSDSLLFAKMNVNQVFQCEFCDFLFAETSDVFQHKAEHNINTGYECSSCQLASRNLKFILNHRSNECPYEMYEKHPTINCNLQFTCSDCEETFSSLASLYEHRHLKSHLPSLFNRASGLNEFFCEKCAEIFGTNHKELISHTETVHTKRGKIQSLPITAVTRPYLCEVCGKGYTQSSHLYQHLRFHKGIKPFECTKAGCNRKFTIRPDLNDHIRKCHTGERPYKCSDCNKTFLTGSVYYQHRLIHRNERRYGCRTCEKRFHRSDALKNHERIHSGEKPYACGVCTKTFRQKGDRDKHFRSRHQNSLLGSKIQQEGSPSNFLIEMTKMRSFFKQVNGIDVLTISVN